MADFILLGKYSAEAMKGISASRNEKANKLVEKFGGKVKSVYALLGEKDLLVIASFPGLEQAMQASIAISKLTGIAFSTSEALPVEVFDRLMEEL